jgi:hypothetical protein
MSKLEQIQTPFPGLTKFLVDKIEKTENDVNLNKYDDETKKSIICNMYDKTKENIKMAHEYIKQRIPSYIDIDKMPLLLSLSIAEYDYTPEIMKIFHMFSSAIHVFFSKDSYDSELYRPSKQIFEMYAGKHYFEEIIDATKDIIWFMYYDCEEDSKLCGIWCGQSYIDACQLIDYDIKNLSEKHFPVISWSYFQSFFATNLEDESSFAIKLEDINLRSFIEQGAIPSGYSRQSIVEDVAELVDEASKNSVDPFKILNLTIDKVLFDENLSDGLDYQLCMSSENRLLAEYGENQLEVLSSSLEIYFQISSKI